MAKKFGLGRGLGSLIPEPGEDQGNKPLAPETQSDMQPPSSVGEASSTVGKIDQEIKYLNPQSIMTSDMQPRQVFEHTALEELVNSIKENGILEPLIVSPLGDNRYKLVAGERRLRAAKIIGLQTVPAIIRTVSEQQRLEFSLIENVQRRDLNSLEEARAYRRLMDEFNLTQEEVSKKVGKSRSKIANSLRLLNLPEEIKVLLSDGRLTEGHAKVILELDDPAKQKQFVKKILQQGLSVREIEGIVKQERRHPGKNKVTNQHLQHYSELLSQKLKTKVAVRSRRRGGVIQIEYYDEEELPDLVERIG